MEQFNVAVLNTPPYRCVSPGYCGVYLKSFISSHTSAACRYVDLNAILFKKIRENAFHQSLVDFVLSKVWDPFKVTNGTIRINKQFKEIDEVISFSDERNNMRFLELISNEIRTLALNSQILMLSIYSIEQLLSAISISKTAKRYNASLKILWGGSLISRFVSEFEKAYELYSFVDVIAFGDGEITNVQYVNCCMNGNDRISSIPGILFRDETGIHKTELKFASSDIINALPAVDYSDIIARDYPSKKVLFPLMISRECYYKRCMFCDNYTAGADKGRFRTADRVIADIKNATQICGATYFRFIDDALPLNCARVLAQEIVNQKISISWGANARCEKLLLNDSVVQLLKESGCKLLFLGLESGSDYVLNLMNKGFTLDRSRSIIKKLHSAGIAVHASFLFGFPGERQSDVAETCAFIMDNLAYLDVVEINFFTLTADSRIYGHLSNRKDITAKETELFSPIVPFSYTDSDKQLSREYSYNACCSMQRLIKATHKTPTLENISRLY